jgi:DNA-binding NarL/FixJ family response regulator
MAVSAPGLDGLEATRTLVARDPRANVVMLTSQDDELSAVADAIHDGARGFLTSDVSREELCAAVAHALGPDQIEVPVLTERERQVLTGMSRGQSNGEIGRELYLSEDTVKTHARRLFRKLGVNDRAQAVALGFRMGLVR